MEFYTKGGAENYRKALEQFSKALEIDSGYSQAALYLGRTYNALFEQQQAEKYFRRPMDDSPPSSLMKGNKIS